MLHLNKMITKIMTWSQWVQSFHKQTTFRAYTCISQYSFQKQKSKHKTKNNSIKSIYCKKNKKLTCCKVYNYDNICLFIKRALFTIICTFFYNWLRFFSNEMLQKSSKAKMPTDIGSSITLKHEPICTMFPSLL